LPDESGAVSVGSRSGSGEVHAREIIAMLGVRIIFGVAIINLLFLVSELSINVIRSFTG